MSRSRSWCFTINNPEDVCGPQSWKTEYLIYQLEQGENATPHLQGYVYFAQPKGLPGMKKLDARAHWAVARGTAAENRTYCSKEPRLEGPWELGTMPTQGKRNDLAELKAQLDSGADLRTVAESNFSSFLRYGRGINAYILLKSEPRRWKTHVSVYYGDSGAGKTRDAHEAMPNAYVLSKKNQNNVWWDGYMNHEDVIIDDFMHWMCWTSMLQLLDRYPHQVETKGGTLPFVAKRIIITSNLHPKEWYPAMTEKYGWEKDDEGNSMNPLYRRIDLVRSYLRAQTLAQTQPQATPAEITPPPPPSKWLYFNKNFDD